MNNFTINKNQNKYINHMRVTAILLFVFGSMLSMAQNPNMNYNKFKQLHDMQTIQWTLF